MVTVTATIEALKSAVASPTSCSSATTLQLRDLLLLSTLHDASSPGDKSANNSSATTKTTSTRTSSRTTVASTRAATKRTTQPKATTSSRATPPSASPSAASSASLSPRERESLATHIINLALRSLTDIAKSQNNNPSTGISPSPSSVSGSASQESSPLQPRPVNRAPSGPTTHKKGKPSTIAPTSGSGNTNNTTPVSAHVCLPTIECARVAFTYLRNMRSSGTTVSLPDCQLEAALSSFIGKLLSLGLHEQAAKDVKVLKKLLSSRTSCATSASASASTTTLKPTTKRTTKPQQQEKDAITDANLPELLAFDEFAVSPSSQALIIATQLHVLRIIAMTRRPLTIDNLVPFLRITVPTSPYSLLVRSAEVTPNDVKIIRQFDILAQSILCLLPSTSAKADQDAMNPKMSPSPAAAFELGTIGLLCRLEAWRHGHVAKTVATTTTTTDNDTTDKSSSLETEIMLPFSRATTALRRRSVDAASGYHVCLRNWVLLQEATVRIGLQYHRTAQASALASIYATLGAFASAARMFTEARQWVEKLHQMAKADGDAVSPVRMCSITAQLAALSLKNFGVGEEEEALSVQMQELLSSMQSTLRGDSTELDQLIVDINSARRSAVGVLMSDKVKLLSPDTKSQLEDFLLHFPKFGNRWLGKKSSPSATATLSKEAQRQEQRRKIMAETAAPIVDSALAVLKLLMDEQQMDPGKFDSTLQECLELLFRVGDSPTGVNANAMVKANPKGGPSHHVKISNLYYLFHVSLHSSRSRVVVTSSSASSSSLSIHMLRRSIDTMQDRSAEERNAAKYTAKLERLYDLYQSKSSTSTTAQDEARRVLERLCESLVSEGLLTTITTLLQSKPSAQAWNHCEQSALLSRTLTSLARLRYRPKMKSQGEGGSLVVTSWTTWSPWASQNTLSQQAKEDEGDEDEVMAEEDQMEENKVAEDKKRKSELTREERLAILEHVLPMIDYTPSDTSNTIDEIISFLQDSFTVEEFPVRRLRFLIRLWERNLQSQNSKESKVDDRTAEYALQIGECLQSLNPLLREQQKIKSHGPAHGRTSFKDQHLLGYVSHWEAYYQSLQSLIRQHTPADTHVTNTTSENPPEELPSQSQSLGLQSSLRVWLSIVSSTSSLEELQRRVEEEEKLLKHVQAISHFAKMKGQDSLCLLALQVSSELLRVLSGLGTDSDTPLSDAPGRDQHHDAYLLSLAELALHSTQMGKTHSANDILQKIKTLLDASSSSPSISSEVLGLFHLAYAEYYIAVGDPEQTEKSLLNARSAFQLVLSGAERLARSRRIMLATLASYLYSHVALYQGESQAALSYIKTCVRNLFREWTHLEAEQKTSVQANTKESPTRSSPSPGGGLEDSLTTEASSTTSSQDGAQGRQTQPSAEAWSLAFPLFRCLSRLSSIYSHIGMFQEALYYSEQAFKIASTADSIPYQAQAATAMATILLHANKFDRGMEIVHRAKGFLFHLEPSTNSVTLVSHLIPLAHLIRDVALEKELFALGESHMQIVQQDLSVDPNDGYDNDNVNDDKDEQLTGKMKSLTLEKTVQKTTSTRATADTASKTVATRTTRSNRATSSHTTVVAAASRVRKTATTKAKTITEVDPSTNRRGRPKTTTSSSTPATTTSSKKSPTVSASSSSPSEPTLILTRAAFLYSQGLAHLHQGHWEEARQCHEESYELARQFPGFHEHVSTMGRGLMYQSLEELNKDAVFSVIQDSTVSYPSGMLRKKTTETDDGNTENTITASPPLPGSAGRTGSLKKRPPTVAAPICTELLQQAQDYLFRAYQAAIEKASSSVLYKTSILLHSVHMFLYATDPNSTLYSRFGPAACVAEVARNVMWKREIESHDNHPAIPADAPWPVPLPYSTQRNADLTASSPSPFSTNSAVPGSLDAMQFQQEFVDILPSQWTVVSMSLSENHRDLFLTKLRKGQTPFVVRLPLVRSAADVEGGVEGQNGSEDRGVEKGEDEEDEDMDDEDEEATLSFQQGADEMREIIRLANESCHSAKEMLSKGEKVAWWDYREALDNRLRELLENMEYLWLGGFRGIFSPKPRHQELLNQFQTTFQMILERHLPSRRQMRNKRAPRSSFVSLDVRVLELFLGLGSPLQQDDNFDDTLRDLLYFVVDILQFHGERNVYDDIDFDTMVLETIDALSTYHQALSHSIIMNQYEQQQDQSDSKQSISEGHTILILDNALHMFPWESLPCMSDIPVSRVPSLACLRRLIQEQRPSLQGSKSSAPGHYVSRERGGTYILNPGSDLPNTQATFQKPLQELGSAWTSIISREPKEAEIEDALTQSDLVLYFGHGSGAQYIRGKTVRRLKKCKSAVLLMGCSSAALEEVGEFQSYGPIWNYMQAGCPAVVGSLWDVTDKEVDRLAGLMFEQWGLLPRGTFTTDRKALKAQNQRNATRRRPLLSDVQTPGSQDKSRSLVESVTIAREACIFRYITAAALCVYGIPTYLE